MYSEKNTAEKIFCFDNRFKERELLIQAEKTWREHIELNVCSLHKSHAVTLIHLHSHCAGKLCVRYTEAP